MSITKQQIFEKAAANFTWVEIDGWGKVGVRSCPTLQNSHRWVTYTNPQTGEIIPEERAKQQIHELIDQLMVDPETPMFDEEDFDALAELDAEKLAPLSLAIREFNSANQKKVTVESADT